MHSLPWSITSNVLEFDSGQQECTPLGRQEINISFLKERVLKAVLLNQFINHEKTNQTISAFDGMYVIWDSDFAESGA